MSAIEFYNSFYELKSPMESFAYNLTKNREDSKDLYQETAFRAIKNRDKFRPGTNFKAWLFTIMKNIFINNYRKKKRANTVLDSTDNNYYINSGKKKVENAAESNFMMEELGNMLNELDSSLEVPFSMYYKGFKYQEIANELAIPLGTVKSRIFFARRELKDLIARRYPGMFNERMN